MANEGTAGGLFAPRRTVLDPIVVAAARTGGATVRHHTRLVEVTTDEHGQATGSSSPTITSAGRSEPGS